MRTIIAVVGNPTSNKGRGTGTCEQVVTLLSQAGSRHGFDVVDLTGVDFDDSLANARSRAYDHLVVVGGDGMVSLGVNAVGVSGKPLGIVATGSGNDFARGLGLPINRVDVAVEGIVGAIVRESHLGVDMGVASSGAECRYYAGMLSCGLDASINDRANHSRLPNGSLRYFAAVLVELAHMKQYGYHVKATLTDGSTDERDIISPLLTVANSRHIGGGIEVSPYSQFDDGLLDLVWLRHVPNLPECADAVAHAYSGGLLGCRVFGWKRVRSVDITRADSGAEPPTMMADGEYVGRLPVHVEARGRALRVLVPPAVLRSWKDGETTACERIARDRRDPITGDFLE